MNRIFSRLGFTAIALVAGPVLMAQQATGAFKGRVTTDKGVPKAGVTVTIVSKSTGFTRAGVTDATGQFSFIALPVGGYTINYTADGQTYRASRSASLGQETDASFLKWPSTQGAVVEVIAVASQASVIDVSSAQVGTTVSSEVIDSLPLISRDINYAAVLAPGVEIVAGSNVDPTKKTSSYITTGDGMGRGTSFAVDGADNNSTDVGGYVLKVPLDAIQEFQVVTNQYKAEFGRSTAGFFNVVTKSGGNEFAGLLGAQYTNDSLRARRTDEGVKSKDALGTYSATVSGPIIKDQLFFMISAERSQGHGVAFDFSPYAISLQPDLGSIKSELETKNVYVKLDWNLSNSLTTSWNYGYYQDITPNQAFPRTQTFAGNITSSALGTGANKTWAAGGRLAWNINSNLVFESHLSYFDYANGIHPKSPGPGLGSNVNTRDADTPHSPRPDQQNLGYGGQDPNAIQNTGIKRTQWKNELTYIQGAHTVKGGLEYQRTTYADQKLFFSETGLYTTGVAGVNYVSAWDPSVVAGQNVLSVSMRADGFQNGISYKQYGIYLQDDWIVNPNWSVYGGLRLDWDTQLDYLKDKYAGMYATIHANSPNFAAINGKAPEGKKYFEPRFQALYRPDGDDKLVFKFGAGHFVANVIDNVTGFSRGLGNKANGLPGLTFRNNQARVFQGLAASSAGSGGVPNFNAGAILGSVNGHPIVLPANYTPYNYANNVNGLRDYFRTTVNSWLTTATADTDGKALLESDFQYPTTDAFNAGVAYRFDDHNAIDATLVYSKSKHLTANLAAADGSIPALEEFDSSANPIGDSIFFSNQTASSLQLQLKYAYTNNNSSFIATLVFKDMKSSEGGAAGAFDASGNTGGLYGEGARYAFKTNPERTSPGTEKMSGAFQYAYRASFGTNFSALASWHSGKAYDVVILNAQGNGASGDVAHSATDFVGTEYGRWQMDLSVRVSQKINLSKKVVLEPYVVIQNLLNNYDYGSNYDGTKTLNSGAFNAGDGSPTSGFGHRGQSYQANSPRNGAIGARLTF
jgi:outer membrane receptor protein involved in Fe transport